MVGEGRAFQSVPHVQNPVVRGRGFSQETKGECDEVVENWVERKLEGPAGPHAVFAGMMDSEQKGGGVRLGL